MSLEDSRRGSAPSKSDQVYRAIMASELLTRKQVCDDIRLAILELLTEFETPFALKPAADPETLMQSAKK